MKKILTIILALVTLPTFASVENPLEHVKEIAKAQTSSDFDLLYELFENATGKEKFAKQIEPYGGKEGFKKTLSEHNKPYDLKELWVVDSVTEAASHRPEELDFLSTYENVKPGYKIVFVGDKERLSYFFFKLDDGMWRMITPGDYAPLPHG